MKNSSYNKKIKNVLIVDDEELFLASLEEGLSLFAGEFAVLTAADGYQALETLKLHDVDLIVTDLKMPKMDGYELLLELMAHYPHIPVIVMTAFGTPEIEKDFQQFDVFDYLEKPIELDVLADKIRTGLSRVSEGHLKGIMLYSFLQLLQLERKTCMLKVNSNEKMGVLCFHQGELIDGIYGELTGEAAAFEIIGWSDSEIEIVNISKKIQRRIKRPLQNILMEIAQLKDEDSRSKLLEESADDNDDFPVNSTETNSRTTNSGRAKNITKQTKKESTKNMADNINQSLDDLMAIDGAMAAALVDSSSGMALGAAGSGVNLDVAAAGNTEVIKSKQKVMASLQLDDKIEDILITLGQQYHLIRPLTKHNNLFFYLVLSREKSNLAMARFKLTDIEAKVQL